MQQKTACRSKPAGCFIRCALRRTFLMDMRFYFFRKEVIERGLIPFGMGQ